MTVHLPMSDAAALGRRFRGALFDLDDTLVDRRAAFRRFTERFYETFTCVGASHSPEDVYRTLLDLDAWGNAPKGPLFAKVLGLWPDIDRSVDELLEFFWDELVAGMRLIEGVGQFLAELSDAGVPWGIVTNGDHRQLDKVAVAGLEDIAPFVIASRLFGADKPDTGVFIEGLRRLGTKADETLFVGDTPHTDILGAQRAGMASAWLPHNREWPGQLEPADYQIAHVADLRPLLLD